ncbi:MAG: alpha/beta hydrolase [Nocardioidaceae bacterium]
MGAEPHLLADFPDQPLVVCLGGAGGLWSDWLAVAHALHGQAHVVAVQRAPGSRSLDEAVAEITKIIQRLPNQPALLVAHSMGGLVGEAMARLRPELVSGLVLVDSSVASRPTKLTSFTERALGASVGIINESLKKLSAHATEVPGAHRWELVTTDLANYELWNDQLMALREEQSLPAITIIVITALRQSSPTRYSWSRQQDRLVKTLRQDNSGARVRHVVLHGAPHLVHLTHAAEVAAEVDSLL